MLSRTGVVLIVGRSVSNLYPDEEEYKTLDVTLIQAYIDADITLVEQMLSPAIMVVTESLQQG